MKSIYIQTLVSLALGLLLCGCPPKPIKIPSGLKLLASGEIPKTNDSIFGKIGGLSGIEKGLYDYEYYLVSDDRSQHGPARFYKAKLNVNWKKSLVEFLPVKKIELKNTAGLYYRPFKEDPTKSIDPEEIRYNIYDHSIWVSNEGERLQYKDSIYLQNPGIYKFDTLGNYKGEIKVSMRFNPSRTEKGIRRNGSLEAMDFTPSHSHLFYATEVPIWQDGSEATTTNGGLLRLVRQTPDAQEYEEFVYLSEKLAYEPQPRGSFGVNGLVSILAIDHKRFISMERSYSKGRKPCTIKLFLCTIADATEVSNLESLSSRSKNIKTIDKKLLLNLDELNAHIDNLEGLAWGPITPRGNRSIIAVADDNFSDSQVSQLFLFEWQ